MTGDDLTGLEADGTGDQRRGKPFFAFHPHLSEPALEHENLHGAGLDILLGHEHIDHRPVVAAAIEHNFTRELMQHAQVRRVVQIRRNEGSEFRRLQQRHAGDVESLRRDALRLHGGARAHKHQPLERRHDFPVLVGIGRRGTIGRHRSRQLRPGGSNRKQRREEDKPGGFHQGVAVNSNPRTGFS